MVVRMANMMLPVCLCMLALLALCAEAAAVLGIDFGSTHIKVSAVNEDGLVHTHVASHALRARTHALPKSLDSLRLNRVE